MQMLQHFVSVRTARMSFLAGASLFGFSQVASAADTWQYSITPYFFAAGIDATVGVGNVETDVDLNAGDVLESTESGFMAMLSARKGKWTFAFDGSYFQLKDGESSSVTGPFGRATAEGTVELTNRQWVYQPMLAYQLLDDRLKMAVYGGARYTRLRANMNVAIDTSLAAFPGNERDFKAEKKWTDYVVGTHGSFPVADRWSLVGMADVGTGEDSDISYQLLGAIKWQFHETVSASLGYRMLHQEFEEDAFSWDATYSGFILGAGFTF